MDARELVSVVGTCLEDVLHGIENGHGDAKMRDEVKRAIAALEALNKMLAATLRTG
jgi:hypothetical protein